MQGLQQIDEFAMNFIANSEYNKIYCALMDAYRKGARNAVIAFAVNKDGEQTVGCGVYSLSQALDMVDRGDI